MKFFKKALAPNVLEFIKTGFTYFLEIQIIVVLAFLLSGAIMMPFSLFVKNDVLLYAITGPFGLLLELAGYSIWFYRMKRNDRRLERAGFMRPFFLAVPLCIVLFLVNNIYTAASGFGIMFTAHVIYYLASNAEYLPQPAEIPYYYFLIMFLVKVILIPALALFGFRLAEKNNQKESQEILTGMKQPFVQEGTDTDN